MVFFTVNRMQNYRIHRRTRFRLIGDGDCVGRLGRTEHPLGWTGKVEEPFGRAGSASAICYYKSELLYRVHPITKESQRNQIHTETKRGGWAGRRKRRYDAAAGIETQILKTTGLHSVGRWCPNSGIYKYKQTTVVTETG